MDKGHPQSMIALSATMSVLAIGAVCARFLARFHKKNSLLMDDWLMIPALLLVLFQGIALIYGTARHAVAYPTPIPKGGLLKGNSSQKVLTQKVEVIATLAFVWELLFAKTSIIFFYRRLFITGHPTLFKWVSLLLVALNVVWGLSFFLVFLFQCGVHVEELFASIVEFKKHCYNGNMVEDSFVISDMALDVILLIMPLPLIWGLQMSRRKKLGISFVMLLGTLTVVVSAVRTAIVVSVTKGIKSDLIVSDLDLEISEVLWWGMLEAGLAVIVPCLPTLHALKAGFGVQSMADVLRSLVSGRSSRASSKVTSNVHTQQPDFVRLEAGTRSAPTPNKSEEDMLVQPHQTEHTWVGIKA